MRCFILGSLICLNSVFAATGLSPGNIQSEMLSPRHQRTLLHQDAAESDNQSDTIDLSTAAAEDFMTADERENFRKEFFKRKRSYALKTLDAAFRNRKWANWLETFGKYTTTLGLTGFTAIGFLPRNDKYNQPAEILQIVSGIMTAFGGGLYLLSKFHAREVNELDNTLPEWFSKLGISAEHLYRLAPKVQRQNFSNARSAMAEATGRDNPFNDEDEDDEIGSHISVSIGTGN